MLRQIEEWEKKYIKFIFNKRFRIFKWNIMISINIDNVELQKEWSKRVAKMATPFVTKTNSRSKTKYVMFNGTYKK